jgi:hypothetical protein
VDPTPQSNPIVLADRAVDGLILAPIDGSAWGALRSLRSAMAGLQRSGRRARLSWVLAVSREGRIVPGRDINAVLLVMGYRLRSSRQRKAGR